MDDYGSSVFVGLLPITTDWCKIELPHLTLVYVGEIKDQKPTTFNELAKDVSMLASLASPLTLRVMGSEVFGDEEKVDVLRIQPTPELWAMRRMLEHWNGSEYPFKPHATIGPVGTSSLIETPRYLAFNKVMVGWGNENLTFCLTPGGSAY